ncbi:MAG: hypothetical protein IJ156_02325 [Bacteroidales bacterium]|nr:hypothetical protein [Bacteroidales bacterium]
MTVNRWICALAAACVLVSGCGKLRMPKEYRDLDEETRTRREYVNLFAWNVMDTYYLWRSEIDPAMKAWERWAEPIRKVADVRYKDAEGNDIDRWTMLTDDFASLSGGVSGHTRTMGLDFRLYYADKAHTRVCAVVTYTCAGSPAEKAGLGRGDAILTLDGEELTPDNYRDLVQDRLLGGGTVKAGLRDGRTVTLTAVDMYEDPVQTVRVLERDGGRKVGYLHYTSFTLDSCEELVDVFQGFTQEGIDDLVLDLRYNGGGYVITETVLAFLLAPVREVEAGSILSREIYNETLAEEWKADTTFFKTGFTYRSGGSLHVVSTRGANPDLPRLYVLVTGASASASESLVCGLKPYMDVILLGGRTAGKYCAGFLMKAEDWYGEVKDALEEGEYEEALPYVDNWGIYVMFARYADRDGRTLSMPDGIAPDYEVDDDPLDGYALGDPRETMLSAALELIDGRTRSVGSGAEPPALEPVPGASRLRPGGLFVHTLSTPE